MKWLISLFLSLLILPQVAQAQTKTLSWTNKADYVSLYCSSNLVNWKLINNYTNTNKVTVTVAATMKYFKGTGFINAKKSWDIGLSWTNPPDASIKGYNVYWDTSRSYRNVQNVSTNLSCFVTNLPSRTRYFFTAKSYNQSNVLSVASNEINYRTPANQAAKNFVLDLTIK